MIPETSEGKDDLAGRETANLCQRSYRHTDLLLALLTLLQTWHFVRTTAIRKSAERWRQLRGITASLSHHLRKYGNKWPFPQVCKMELEESTSARTNELTRTITTEVRNINNVVKDFNSRITKVAKETIPIVVITKHHAGQEN